MSFRERDEYKLWREQVFVLFGRKCIRCGYAGNLHTHHVKAVHTYPELAFDPRNGVPLCGNCHALANGREAEFAEDLLRLQTIILGEDQESSEAEARQAAELNPSDADSVEPWLNSTDDSLAVVAFYRTHRDAIPRTPIICQNVLRHLHHLCVNETSYCKVIEEFDPGSYGVFLPGRGFLPESYTYCKVTLKFYDECRLFLRDEVYSYYTVAYSLLHLLRLEEAIRFTLAGLKRGAEKPDRNCASMPILITHIADALIRIDQRSRAMVFLKKVLVYDSYPQYGGLALAHLRLGCLYPGNREKTRAADLDASERHIAIGLSRLDLNDFHDVMRACRELDAIWTYKYKKYHPAEMELAKQAYSIADSPEKQIAAMGFIAFFYYMNDVYDASLAEYRKILSIDETNVDAMERIATCYQRLDRHTAARDMARKCLLFDPDNSTMLQIVQQSEDE